MYPVSGLFKKCIKANSRQFSIDGNITLVGGRQIKITGDEIKKGTLSIDNQCVNGSEMEIGTVYAAEMSITLFTNLDRYMLFDAVINLTFNLKLNNGKIESVPLGEYTISEADRNYSSVSLTGYDNMLKFDKTLGETAIGTPYELALFCCDKCGVELGNTKAELEKLMNGTIKMSVYEENDLETYRDLLYYIAQVLCSFATIGRDGKLYFRQFTRNVVDTIPHEQRKKSSFSDFVTRYTAISSTNQRTKIAEYYALEKDDGLTMNLGTNPLIQYGLQETREKILNNILNGIALINYTPFEVSHNGDPSLELGDVIKFSGGHADESAISCLTHINFQYNSKSTLKCVGKNPKLSGVKSKNDKNLAGILNKVDNNDIAMYRFTNAGNIEVGKVVASVAYIAYTSIKKTDAEFKAIILLDATITDGEEGVVTFKFYLDGNLITDFIPQQTIRTGKHILNLFYPIMGVEENKRSTMEVTIKLSNGTGKILKFGVRASVLGQGFAAKESEWDGRLEFYEDFDAIQLGGLTVGDFDEEVSTALDDPIPNRFSEEFASIVLGGMEIGGFEADLVPSILIKTNTLNTNRKEEFTYNAMYIKTVEKFELQTAYSFAAVEQEIDQGRMSVIEIDTSQFDRVEEIEVK